MLKNKLVNLKVKNLTSDEDCLNYLSQKLYEEGIVKESFISAIVEREKNFPTGLSLGNTGIAIPHADTEHVIENQIAIMTLEKPVEFKQMGDLTVRVPVSAVFMLSLKEASGHLEMLQKLMNFLQNKDDLEKLISLDSEEKNQAIDILYQNNIIN